MLVGRSRRAPRLHASARQRGLSLLILGWESARLRAGGKKNALCAGVYISSSAVQPLR